MEHSIMNITLRWPFKYTLSKDPERRTTAATPDMIIEGYVDVPLVYDSVEDLQKMIEKIRAALGEAGFKLG